MGLSLPIARKEKKNSKYPQWSCYENLTALWLSWFNFPLSDEDIKIKAFDCGLWDETFHLLCRKSIYTPFRDGWTNPHLVKIEYFFNPNVTGRRERADATAVGCHMIATRPNEFFGCKEWAYMIKPKQNFLDGECRSGHAMRMIQNKTKVL